MIVIFKDIEKTLYLFMLGKLSFREFKNFNITCESLIHDIINDKSLEVALCAKANNNMEVSLRSERGWMLWLTNLPYYGEEYKYSNFKKLREGINKFSLKFFNETVII